MLNKQKFKERLRENLEFDDVVEDGEGSNISMRWRNPKIINGVTHYGKLVVSSYPKFGESHWPLLVFFPSLHSNTPGKLFINTEKCSLTTSRQLNMCISAANSLIGNDSTLVTRTNTDTIRQHV